MAKNVKKGAVKTRHRWDEDSNKCKRCKLKMGVKKVKDGRPGDRGKIEQTQYLVKGSWTPEMPRCTGPA